MSLLCHFWKKCNIFYCYKTLNLLVNLPFFSDERRPRNLSAFLCPSPPLLHASLCLQRLTCMYCIHRVPGPLCLLGLNNSSSGRKLTEGEESNTEVVMCKAFSLSGAERSPALSPATEAYCSSQSGWLSLIMFSSGSPVPHILGPTGGIVWLLLSWSHFEKGIESLIEIGKLEWIYYVQPAQPSLVRHLP